MEDRLSDIFTEKLSDGMEIMCKTLNDKLDVISGSVKENYSLHGK